ncbi:AAA family ATPase [Paracoccaceae bacterium]|nr:AAA family ATPase [Paracoccaceae bacterium]
MIKKENHRLEIFSNQETSFLFGHDKQINFLLDRIKMSQIPNAWLFHGPRGIGKASLALNVGKVISNIDFSKKNRVTSISEEDIRNPKTSVNINNVFYCRKKWDEKKKLFQKYISIEDIRELTRKFYLSSTDNSYKVCIVDTTEDLNISASNSLLKILEEPPKNTLFILVSNNQQSIIPTILSRCQKVGFQRLNEKDLRDICTSFLNENQFDQPIDADAVTSCDGSARKLLNFLDQDYIKIFNTMKTLFLDLPNFNKRKAIAVLAGNKDYLSGNDSDKSAFGILLRLVSSLAKKEITLKINTKFVHDDIALIAAHLYSQISLLRYESLEYNLESKKAVLLALNTIELAFAEHKKK